jgi:hypothetical protein
MQNLGDRLIMKRGVRRYEVDWMKIKVAGEGKLRHQRCGWLQAIRRGDKGKNLVFFNDMSHLYNTGSHFLSQCNEGFQLTNFPLKNFNQKKGKDASRLVLRPIQEPSVATAVVA